MKLNKIKLMLSSILVITCLIIPNILPANVLAAQCGDTQTNVIGGDICSGVNSKSSKIEDNAIYVILREVVKILSGLVMVIAVVMMLISGFMYSTAGDKDEQITKAKGMMRNTIVGIILYMAMTLILNFLIPGGIL